jgi:tetratricopeptide (TPR) repeat protein
MMACSRASSGRDVRISATPQTPEIIAKLEQGRRDNPASAPAARALGISYYKAGRFQDAREALEAARRLDPNDGATALYLGLTHESLDDIPSAREAYTRYLTTGKTKAVRQQLQSRLVFLTKKELELAAKRSIANETELASQPGSPTTIAVLPLTFSGADTSLVPLERGVAELLVTDLGRIDRLTIVERDRLQALVEEITRTQGATFDSTSQLRTGRLLRAGRIIQGTITQTSGNALTMNAAVVDVPTSQVLRTARSSDQLEQLFSMEKQLVMQILDALGMQLTARERGLIEQRPTRSLTAFLAYSRGLQEEDRGNLERANAFYQQAVRIDPSFSGAQTRGATTQAAVSGSQVTSASVESSLQGTTEGAVVAAAEQGTASNNQAGPSTSGTLSSTTNSLNPSATSAATTTGATASGQTQTTSSGAPSTNAPAGGGQTNNAPPSNPNPASAATGGTSPTTPAVGIITIVIKPPTE